MATDRFDSLRIEAIKHRAADVRRRMDEAASAAGRDPDSVHLIAVTKFFEPEVAAAAVAAGLTELGENRVQELLAKQSTLADWGLFPNWHLIGTLQKNKVRQIIGRTSLVHSGDSLDLLAEISKRSVAAGVVTRVLLQINPARETTKHGFEPAEFSSAAAEAIEMPGIFIEGIMCMAPQMEDPSQTIPYFQLSADLFRELAEMVMARKPERAAPSILSMGMSEDFPYAIACGATHIRLGTALFGPRPTLL